MQYRDRSWIWGKRGHLVTSRIKIRGQLIDIFEIPKFHGQFQRYMMGFRL
jgi:hypothetical protein